MYIDEGEELLCFYCAGSGMGRYDGTICIDCKGSGIERETEDDDGYADYIRDMQQDEKMEEEYLRNKDK